MIQTSSYNWMSQDLTYWDDWECTYMNNVSIDQMKYEELAPTYTLISGWNTWITDTITHMLETPAGVISCGNSKVLLNGWDKSATVAWATRVEYMLDSSGNQINYFFQNANVVKTNSAITSVTNTEAKPVSGLTTATCVVYNTILYSTGSVIYSYDTITDTSSVALSTLNVGITIKNIYLYNDMLVITSTIGNDTVIYQAQFDGTAYEIYSTEVKQWITAVSATWDSGIVYWISNNRIFGFSGGQSQEIRFLWYNYLFWENFIGWSLAFKDGDLYIGYGTTIYTFGAKHAGRRNSITTKTIPTGTIQYITANYVHVQATTNYIYTNSSRYPNTWFTISLPYDMWVNGIEKSGLAMRVWYRLQTGTSIDLYVQTDEMQIDNTTNWTLIASITDTTKRNQYITLWEINAALAGDTWDSKWQEIRIKRVYNGGGWSSGLRYNTPRFYDLEFIHTQENERLKSA